MNNGNTRIGDSLEDQTFVIPENSYWVMGDNRIISVDSRQCFAKCTHSGATHFLRRDAIVGKVAVSLGYFNIFDEQKNFHIYEISLGK